MYKGRGWTGIGVIYNLRFGALRGWGRGEWGQGAIV